MDLKGKKCARKMFYLRWHKCFGSDFNNSSLLSRRQGGNFVMCLFFNLVTQLPSHLVHKLHPSSDDFHGCFTISFTHEFISWTFSWLESPFRLHKHSHIVSILVNKINLYFNFILYLTFHVIECVIAKRDTCCKTCLSPISINIGWKVTMAFQQTLKKKCL
jgi:hypothetical protein